MSPFLFLPVSVPSGARRNCYCEASHTTSCSLRIGREGRDRASDVPFFSLLMSPFLACPLFLPRRTGRRRARRRRADAAARARGVRRALILTRASSRRSSVVPPVRASRFTHRLATAKNFLRRRAGVIHGRANASGRSAGGA